MAVYYLDIDDEITSAAARIRGTADLAVALVLPAGSRIATSRINFRLLAREALERSRRLAIVAPEASARALAAAAGLPVFASVVEYEDALARPAEARPEEPPARVQPGPARPGSAALAASRGREEPVPRDQARRLDVEAYAARAAAPGPPPGGGHDGGGAVGPTTGLATPPTPRPARRGRRRTVLLGGTALIALAALVGGVTGYVILPTATVVLTPRTADVGPIDVEVRADPDAAAPDSAAGVVPATRLQWALSAEGTFPATGQRVDETKASGSVRWQNCDPTRAYTVPRGTIVRTAAGLGFATQDAAFLPVASITIHGGQAQVDCTQRNVAVTAAKAGPAGNVDAGTITVIPGAYNPTVIRVTNPAPTTGGTRTEFPKVTQKDIDAALAALTIQLDAQLAAAAADPPDLPPGATAVPGTASRTDPVPTVDVATLLDQEVAEFGLGVGATASLVTYEPSVVQALAAGRVGERVPSGYALLPDSVAVGLSPATAEDGLVVVVASARARAIRRVDPAEVRAIVRGRTPAEATALLEPFGAVVITTWPDWATTITTFDARLEVRVETLPSPLPGGSPSPSTAPAALPSPAPGSAAP